MERECNRTILWELNTVLHYRGDREECSRSGEGGGGGHKKKKKYSVKKDPGEKKTKQENSKSKIEGNLATNNLISLPSRVQHDYPSLLLCT